MAEGWNRNIHCRSFAAGDACRSPSPYPHQQYRMQYSYTNTGSNNNDSAPPRMNHRHSQTARSPTRERMPPLCRFYRNGNCAYGRNCRFVHVLDGNGTKPNNWSNSTSIGSRSGVSSDSPTSAGSNHSRKTSVSYQDCTSSSNSLLNSEISDEQSERWVNAPEFIPSGKDNIPEIKSTESGQKDLNQSHENGKTENKLCPQLQNGKCENGADCPYLHGDTCELCGQACLHPHDVEQRKKHNNECIKQHEQDMELSFAVARSKDKACGICFETIMEKNHREQRFGILPNCSHCFCLTCIRKWRQSKQFENKIVRSCPECRVTSDFVCPSMYWVDTKEDKDKLIRDYKGALSVKNCKYFRSGRGKCPFGNKCFYLHALPDGTKADVGPPVRRRRRRGSDEDFHALLQFFVWDFLDEFEDFVTFSSDSEDSYGSEYDLFLD
ncbi:probable E3 ubiquitin-protein ligase makorin-1 [Anabrus simplex]|uniref:probable E3 ubiquitin-protein ligase makorin-1 n=1 Tax=Anabrus simplex TaxID=316456 RepID=UPI0034DCE48E